MPDTPPSAVKPPSESVLRQMLDKPALLTEMSGQHGMSLRELALWLDADEHQRVLANLITIASMQSQLRLAQFGSHAAYNLIHLTNDPTINAAQRRLACVDVLRTQVAAAKQPHRGVPLDLTQLAREWNG